MNDKAWWNYGVLAIVALGCLVLVIRYFRRALSDKGNTECNCCSSAGLCSSQNSMSNDEALDNSVGRRAAPANRRLLQGRRLRHGGR